MTKTEATEKDNSKRQKQMAQLKLAATDASAFGGRGVGWEIFGVEASRR
jgi:hypothetical protein